MHESLGITFAVSRFAAAVAAVIAAVQTFSLCSVSCMLAGTHNM